VPAVEEPLGVVVVESPESAAGPRRPGPPGPPGPPPSPIFGQSAGSWVCPSAGATVVLSVVDGVDDVESCA
jgi:hypothetical protein